jgi:hypothetical protein
MIANSLFFLIHFALAGTRFTPSTSHILSAFNENIAMGDIKAVHSLINSYPELITSPSAMPLRNEGFLTAVKEGRPNMANFLIKSGNVDVTAKNNLAIQIASAKGDVEMVKLLLLKSEVNAAAMGNKALIAATRGGHTEVVRLLMKRPKLKSTNGYYHAAYLADDLGNPDIVKLFIGNGKVNPTPVKMHALEKATKLGNTDLVRYMLTFPDYHQEAYMMLVSKDLNQIKTLFRAGYKYHENTRDTVLQYHRLWRNTDIVEYLESQIIVPK